MTGFELRISDIISDRSTNWATTTTLLFLSFSPFPLSLFLSVDEDLETSSQILQDTKINEEISLRTSRPVQLSCLVLEPNEKLSPFVKRPSLTYEFFWKNSSFFCSALVLWKNPPSNDGSTQGLNNYGGYLPTCQHTGQFIYLKTKRSWVWVTSMLIEEKSYVIKNKPHYSGLGWYTKPF